jgi:hypothetical protein
MAQYEKETYKESDGPLVERWIRALFLSTMIRVLDRDKQKHDQITSTIISIFMSSTIIYVLKDMIDDMKSIDKSYFFLIRKVLVGK